MAQDNILNFLKDTCRKEYYYTVEAIACKMKITKSSAGRGLHKLHKYGFINRLSLFQKSGSPLYIYSFKSPL